MKVTKQQVIDAVSQSSVFKFVDDPISSRTFTVEWKGKRFLFHLMMKRYLLIRQKMMNWLSALVRQIFP